MVSGLLCSRGPGVAVPPLPGLTSVCAAWSGGAGARVLVLIILFFVPVLLGWFIFQVLVFLDWLSWVPVSLLVPVAVVSAISLFVGSLVGSASVLAVVHGVD